MPVPHAAVARRYRPRRPVDLRLTLSLVARPATTLLGDDDAWRATRTPDGPATLHIRSASDGTLEARAWGPGGPWAVEHLPDLVGDTDDVDGFRPPRGSLDESNAARLPGLRIPRTRAVAELLVPVVLEQKVIGKEARRSYAALVRRFGEAAPGSAGDVPTGLRLPPAPGLLAALPSYAFPPLGIDGKRAATLRRVAGHAARLDACVDVPLPEAHRRMQLVPGVGAWTAAEVAVGALGDSDAVSVGDYHLPNLVSWALAGEARGTDDRMLELLEPYCGHRGRVVRQLERSIRHAPRYGPRLSLRDLPGTA